MATASEINHFWIEETGPKGWFMGGEELDNTIRARFMPDWEEAAEGARGLWLTDAEGALAYLILTDQFPRNMFRGDGRSFLLDPLARAAAKLAIAQGWDLTVPEPQRQMFYLPLMHSENLVDQDRSVALHDARMSGDDRTLHARAHRDVIREFGRFPYRNDALGRVSSAAERAYLDAGGYRLSVERLQS